MEANGNLPSEVVEDCVAISAKEKFIVPGKYEKDEVRYDSGYNSLPEKFENLVLTSECNEEKKCPIYSTISQSCLAASCSVPSEFLNVTTQNPDFYSIFDDDGDYMLHLAVIQGNCDIILLICEKIPNNTFINVVNYLHQTPLHLAVLMKRADICKLLLQYGASVDVRDRHGQTPLHIACEKGYLDCVKILTHTNSNFQDLELMNYEGFTCFHLAVIKEHNEIISHLYNLKANVNAQDGKSGRSALHYAVEAQNAHLIGCLVKECFADINITTYAGLTPERLAKGRGYDEIHQLLIELGADEEFYDDDMSDTDSSDYDDLVNKTNCNSKNQNYINNICWISPYDDLKLGPKIIV